MRRMLIAIPASEPTPGNTQSVFKGLGVGLCLLFNSLSKVDEAGF